MRFISILCLCVCACTARAQTPIPTVEGPLPVTPDSYPFGAADHTLAAQNLSHIGYVEEEFLLSGKANVYDWKEDGSTIVRTPGAPYTTRVLVRRPIAREDFSGNVVVEMLNPSNYFDLNIGWAMSHEEMVRNGDAWVGITAKPIAVEALQNFNPERYAKLSWANPLPADDPRNCDRLTPDTTQATENGLVWDIHSQTAAWIRSDDSSNPFTYGDASDQPVEYLYGWGYSQTGSFLYTYINAVQPLVVKSDGRPLFDGYIVAVSGGPSNISQCATRLDRDDPRRQFRNAGVPVMRIMTQSDYLRTRQSRRPDSDEPGDEFRNYEIAGSGHATPDELSYCAAPEDIIKADRDVPPMDCNEGPRSRFPNSIFFNAALRNLDRWVREGIPAPRAENIMIDGREPVLDEHGNVVGGVRSPYVDVPTSTWMGNSTGPSFCRIAGHEIPFDRDKLRELYPTHATYVEAVRANVEDLVAQRFIMPADGARLIEEAEATEIP